MDLKKPALLRQWELLKLLSVARYAQQNVGKWDKASELCKKLEDLGYSVTVRTVQRDMLLLRDIFPGIESNTQNPKEYGWRWRKGAKLDVQGLSMPEALMLAMAELNLKSALPSATFESLEPLFYMAKYQIEKHSTANYPAPKNWLSKVKILADNQLTIPPQIDLEIHKIISIALMCDKQIKALYRKSGAEHAKEYILNPLGLICKGQLIYLVATVNQYQDVMLFALHRFSQATELNQSAIIPHGFNLDDEIKKGKTDFGATNTKIALEFNCTKELMNYLVDVKLSVDQTITPAKSHYLVTATVMQTWQLEWWLMGHSDQLEIISPQWLRDSIQKKLKTAIEQYPTITPQ
jgi:predicted DNA-binding transcriptional regulator YafY